MNNTDRKELQNLNADLTADNEAKTKALQALARHNYRLEAANSRILSDYIAVYLELDLIRTEIHQELNAPYLDTVRPKDEILAHLDRLFERVYKPACESKKLAG